MLKPFGDRDVTECAIRIVRTGDGLSEALALEPVELDHDETVHVVLRCAVTKVTYEQIKDSDDLRRVHTLAATLGTLVDEDTVGVILDAVQRASEQAAGVQRIPGTDG